MIFYIQARRQNNNARYSNFKNKGHRYSDFTVRLRITAAVH